MVVIFSHFASGCFRHSVFSLSKIYNHHLLHYTFQNPIHNFSSTCLRFRTRVTNSSEAICIEENGGSSGAADVIRSPNLVALEYADLNLPLICEEVGNIRVRQHVNPLSSTLSVPAEVPDWNDVFRDSSLPLIVDIGCGSGRFLLWLAKRNFGSNYLGLEIRKKLVTRANFWAKELNLLNSHFMFANATISFQQLASSYPGPLVLVSVLCPDPHFKKRHHKRRVLQKPLVDSIVDNLASGGQVFVQSDVHEVAVDMRNQFDIVSDMLHIDTVDPNFGCDPDGWLVSNPMGIRTEREVHAELEGAKMYRRMYQKRT
ncbi:hypothetical protein SOVF_161140 isoform A [Spinacia oleracea]|uniref:tRNA (guanine(46)-N(7))-methyltransferase n=1 Tax=Spinacia oleracea TaxID=3562 RepID=A0A9R0JXT8_SPIOL|nr:uncharacterized protein LOC110790098 isoform X2 [Spinacia oleracea]KNA08566.1 hypothetical protein SOVF_161140 isoform A [Spinacia oleracea]